MQIHDYLAHELIRERQQTIAEDFGRLARGHRARQASPRPRRAERITGWLSRLARRPHAARPRRGAPRAARS